MTGRHTDRQTKWSGQNIIPFLNGKKKAMYIWKVKITIRWRDYKCTGILFVCLFVWKKEIMASKHFMATETNYPTFKLTITSTKMAAVETCERCNTHVQYKIIFF